MVVEELKYYVVLERHPMQVGFPKELQFSKYWYACLNKARGFDWTDDITEAREFDTPEAAVEFMRSGMFSKQFMVHIPGFSCHVVRSCKSVSPLFNLAEVKDELR